jgi:aldehyde dehydrogenase
VVLKPAEQTPASILVLRTDRRPAAAGRAQHRQRLRPRGRQAARLSNRIAKIAFTGETTTGRLIMQYARQNLIPVTLELGGKSPNIFFADVMAEDDDFFDKALEGFAMFALNQGEVCTCPSRALVQESIYDRFMERGEARRGDQAGRSRSTRHDDRRAGLVRAAGEDPVLPRHRQAGRRQGADRRRASATC